MKGIIRKICHLPRLAAVVVALAGATALAGAQEEEMAGDAVKGEKIFKQCSACHKIGEDAKNAVGPVLNGIVGRTAGSYEGYKYGTGLKAANEKGLVWDEETIFGWIEDPRKYIREYLDDKKAKAKMTFKLKDEQKRRDVIEYLKTL